MPRFMLVLHDNPAAFAHVTPEMMQKIIEEYNSWAGKLGAAGHLLGGEKLKEEGGKRLRQDHGKVLVTDGPYSETKEVIGGYFLLKADSYAHAVELSRDCPHLKYQGILDVREVDEIAG